MEHKRKNINRGYRKQRVWQEAIEYYVKTYQIFSKFPFELKKISSNQIASVDSIHRNTTEGYCRKSSREYLNFLTIAKASMGEFISGLHACKEAGQISVEEFEVLDTTAYKLENGLLRLIKILEEQGSKA